MHLLVPNILFFRHLAGRALKKQLSAQGSNASSRSDGTTASNKRPSLDLALEDAAKRPNSPNEAVLKEMTMEADFSHASSSRSACIVQCPACKDQILRETSAGVCLPQWSSDCSVSFRTVELATMN